LDKVRYRIDYARFEIAQYPGQMDRRANTSLAFRIAAEHLGIPVSDKSLLGLQAGCPTGS